VQVDPMKTVLNAPGIKHLKLKHDEPLSNLGFISTLRRYNKGGHFSGINRKAQLKPLMWENIPEDERLPPVGLHH